MLPADPSLRPELSLAPDECLGPWRREPTANNLQPLVERYGALVYSSAQRRTGSAQQAAEVTQAVFLVLARRARALRQRTVLAGWLFHVTALVCRRAKRPPRPARWWRWFSRRPQLEHAPQAPLWDRLAPELDAAIDRLPAKQRNAVLLRLLLNQDWESLAGTLRLSVVRARQRVDRGLNQLLRRLRRRGVSTTAEAVAHACSEGGAVALPADLTADLLRSMAACRGRRPLLPLARRTLRTLAWARWRRRLVLGMVTLDILLAVSGVIAWRIDARTGHSWLISTIRVWWVRHEVMRVPGMAVPPQPWPNHEATRPLDARVVRHGHDLYRTTNIWLVHLTFAREQWQALDPKRIEPLPNFIRPDGMLRLRNPRAQRSGLAGVFGYEFDWTRADLEFGHVLFTNVAVRVRGNMTSLCWPKRAFQVDLNRFSKGQKLGGLDELTLNNLVWDYSCLGDALGYEFFRDAGVPASRTSYAWLSATVARSDPKPLGLYLLVEPVGEEFAAERFGSKKTPVFKPATYALFEYLGEDWSAYAAIYEVKTQILPEQARRVIDFARLVSSASDAAFASQVGDFLDLDEFARFLAAEVLLSNYDSLLSTGHNFYMYLDRRSNKLGFIPWDLDAAWGDFWIATKPELERASIWHPWVGTNRFLERLLACEEFRRIYRGHLEDFLVRLFAPRRLHRRIDELAAVLRDPMSAESAFRRAKFEQAVGREPVPLAPGEAEHGVNHPAHPLKRFIEKRAEAVRRQLDGTSKGMILPALSQR